VVGEARLRLHGRHHLNVCPKDNAIDGSSLLKGTTEPIAN